MLPPDRQPSPPPPLPPRAAHSGPAPPPVPPQTYKSYQQQQQQVAPPAFSRRMSPVSRDSPYRGTPAQPQSQSSPANSVGSRPATPQRGMSPSSAHQPVIKQQQNLCQPGAATYDHRTQGLSPPAPPVVPLEDSGYASSGSGSQGPKYRNPPPYTYVLPSKPHQSFYNDQNSIILTHAQLQQGQHNSSPMSSHSPSPAPTPQSHSPMIHGGVVGHATHKQPVPVQAWNAKQPPIIMQQVKSREVPKPVLQTATAPLSPPLAPHQPPRQYVPQGGGSEQLQLAYMQHPQQNQYSYITEVSTRVNQPRLQVNLPCTNRTQCHSNSEHHFYPQVPQQQHQQQQQQYQGQNIHSMQIRNGSLEHVQRHAETQPYQAGMLQQVPGRTINFHIENNGTNHTIQVQPGYGMTHYSSQEHRVPPLHPMMDINDGNRYHNPQQTDTPESTPRSRSPVSSRVLNNQSPSLSVISMTSTPSTSSDVPDKPPPPYPGKLLNPQPCNQILQPAGMVHVQYTVPPYSQQPPSGACSETSSTTSSNYASSNYTDVKSTTSSNYTDISRFDQPIAEEASCDIPLSIDLPPPPEYPHPDLTPAGTAK